MIRLHTSPIDITYHKGDIFLHFTGNIFGIGCSALDHEAVQKVNGFKDRDPSKGNILLFSSFSQICEYDIPLLKDKKVASLIKQYSPGNLTFILPVQDERLDHITKEGRIAARIPGSVSLRQFIQDIGSPIVSTSINVSGDPFENDLTTISTEYADWFDYGLYNPDEPQELPIPSTIIEFVYDIDSGIRIECTRLGSIDFNEILESWQKPLIQFVCFGNICRSPLAEIYARHLIETANLPYRTASCGFLDSVKPISEHSRTILENLGLPHNNRRSIHVTNAILRQSMVVLCMTADIKRLIRDEYPDFIHKIFTFAEYTQNLFDIPDPYNMDFEAYYRAFKLIKKYSEDLIEMLKKE